MDKDIKRFLGKILGEIYRTQSMISGKPPAASRIYSLTHGFESAIDEELERIGWVPDEQEEQLGELLNEIAQDQEKLDRFRGFYDIEDELKRRNIAIGRGQVSRILTKMKSEEAFVVLIEKMDSNHSPAECKRFDIRDDH